MNTTKDNGSITNFPGVNNSDQNMPSDSLPKSDKNILRKILHNPDKLWNIINGSLAAAVILAIAGGGFNLYKINKALENTALQEDVESIDFKMTLYNEKFDDEYKRLESEFDDFEDKFDDIKLQVNVMQATNITYKSCATDSFQKNVINLCKKDNISSVTDALWDNSDVLATNGEEKYTVEELVGKKLLLSYMQKSQEVYFYGQYSDNKRWDGDCIINVYSNDKLQLITEASYNDGILEKYQQAYTYFTAANEEVWCFSNRECTDKGNLGDSWNYFKDSDIKKEFTMETVEASDIYNVAQVRQKVKEELNADVEGFYHGITLNGNYNDDSGDSYIVKFSKKDGTVRTLYVGNFVDGKLEDETGDAWYIVRNDDKIDYKYAYYTGRFEDNGSKDKWTEENSKQNLTLDDITDIIDVVFIKPELTWHGFEEL